MNTSDFVLINILVRSSRKLFIFIIIKKKRTISSKHPKSIVCIIENQITATHRFQVDRFASFGHGIVQLRRTDCKDIDPVEYTVRIPLWLLLLCHHPVAPDSLAKLVEAALGSAVRDVKRGWSIDGEATTLVTAQVFRCWLHAGTLVFLI